MLCLIQYFTSLNPFRWNTTKTSKLGMHQYIVKSTAYTINQSAIFILPNIYITVITFLSFFFPFSWLLSLSLSLFVYSLCSAHSRHVVSTTSKFINSSYDTIHKQKLILIHITCIPKAMFCFRMLLLCSLNSFSLHFQYTHKFSHMIESVLFVFGLLSYLIVVCVLVFVYCVHYFFSICSVLIVTRSLFDSLCLFRLSRFVVRALRSKRKLQYSTNISHTRLHLLFRRCSLPSSQSTARIGCNKT